jgi:hypothetical protein
VNKRHYMETQIRALHGREVEPLASDTNQTGIEMLFPDFLPITLILIRR